MAQFNINLAASVLDVPYPHDLHFANPGAPVDGMLNIPALPWRSAAMTAALNSQDGWSTTASLTTGFTRPLDLASISGSSVKIIELWLDPTTTAPATHPAHLPSGATNLVAGVLAFSTGPTVNDSVTNLGKVLNLGYLVVPIDPTVLDLN